MICWLRARRARREWLQRMAIESQYTAGYEAAARGDSIVVGSIPYPTASERQALVNGWKDGLRIERGGQLNPSMLKDGAA